MTKYVSQYLPWCFDFCNLTLINLGGTVSSYIDKIKFQSVYTTVPDISPSLPSSAPPYSLEAPKYLITR